MNKSDLGLGLQKEKESFKKIVQNVNNTNENESNENGIGKALKVIGILIIIAGFITGFATVEDNGPAVMFICFVSGFISGILFMGIGEIIALLQKIVDKK